MKKRTKILSFLIAGVTVVTSLFAGSVTASAASNKLKLVTAPYKADSYIMDMGRNVGYVLRDGKASFVSFSAKAAENLRKTGKIKLGTFKVETSDGKDYTLPTETIIDVSSRFAHSNSAMIKDINGIEYAFFYDKDNKKIVYYDTECGDHSEFLAPNGNRLFFYEDAEGNRSFTLYSHDLSEKITEIKGNYRFSAFINGSKYCFLVDSKSEEPCVLILNQNGKIRKIVDKKLYAMGAGYEHACFCEEEDADYIDFVYLTTTNKMYPIKNISKIEDKVSGITYNLNCFMTEFYGTKAVARYLSFEEDVPLDKYILVDVENDKICSEVFDNVYALDGETPIYVIKNGKGGFIDLNGKELKWFDEACRFYKNCDYAAVVNKGKFFLVDKNFNVVSEKIKVEEGTLVYSYANDIYIFIQPNGEKFVVTYK